MNKKDVEALFEEPFDDDDQFIVKVFDPIKAKRDHKNNRNERTDTYYTCHRPICARNSHMRFLQMKGYSIAFMLTKNMYSINSI